MSKAKPEYQELKNCLNRTIATLRSLNLLETFENIGRVEFLQKHGQAVTVESVEGITRTLKQNAHARYKDFTGFISEQRTAKGKNLVKFAKTLNTEQLTIRKIRKLSGVEISQSQARRVLNQNNIPVATNSHTDSLNSQFKQMVENVDTSAMTASEIASNLKPADLSQPTATTYVYRNGIPHVSDIAQHPSRTLVEEAIARLKENGNKVSAASVAEETGLSRASVYNYMAMLKAEA